MRSITARLAPVLALAGLLHGCATLDLAKETSGLPSEINLRSVPFHPQTEYHCGPAAVATILEHSGTSVDYQQLVDQIYVPGLRGSLQAEISAAISRLSCPCEPKLSDPEMSTASMRVCWRSSSNVFTYGVSIRAVTFQSIVRTSSPNW